MYLNSVAEAVSSNLECVCYADQEVVAYYYRHENVSYSQSFYTYKLYVMEPNILYVSRKCLYT